MTDVVDVDFMSLQEAARRSGVSVSFLRRSINAASHPLQVYRFGRGVRVHRVDLAQWTAGFRDTERDEMDAKMARFRRDCH
jgi:excisionase family DNA binding protein